MPKRTKRVHACIRFLFYGEGCPIEQERRKKRIDFVLGNRKNWLPGKTSYLFSNRRTYKTHSLERAQEGYYWGLCILNSERQAGR